VILDPVTARYAGALFGLARRKSVQAAVAADIALLATEIGSPATRRVLFNPRVDRSAKRAQLAGTLARLSPLTQNFVNLLFDKHREEVLRDLQRAWRVLELEERGTVEGVVESARPIDAAELAELGTALGARLGKQLVLHNRIVPELVGGARVTAAHRMIDYSVQGRLEALRRKLMDARLPGAPSSSGR
jgi:ATP synthase F1 delta subunit